MQKDIYIYPCVFVYKESGGIGVYFPDLDGCTSSGEDEQAACHNAKEALSLHLYGMEQDGEQIPEPSRIMDIKLDENKGAILVEAYMPTFRARQKLKMSPISLIFPTVIYINACWI